MLTPTARTSRSILERATAFWQALGSRVRLMDPGEHDRALALTSHLPHLAASALAGILSPELYELTASGFRDTTRLAAGSPGLWATICWHNRQALVEALGLFQERLDDFRRALEAGDMERVGELLAQGRKVKEDLKKESHLGRKD